MEISKHAQIRAQQRGIPESIVELIVDYGEPKDAIGRVIAYEISGGTINCIQFQIKKLLQSLERLKGKVVLVGDDGTIITTYHKNGKRK